MNLTIDIQAPQAQTRIVDLEGEVDVYTSTQLKQDIARIIDEGVKFVVLNLSKVEYLDSTGLGVLIGSLKRLKENEGNLVIVSPSVRIMRVFEITGLFKIFHIYQNLEEAAQKEGFSL